MPNLRSAAAAALRGGVRSTFASGRERHSDRITSAPLSSVAEARAMGSIAGTGGATASARTCCPSGEHSQRPSSGARTDRTRRRASSPRSTRARAFGRWDIPAREARTPSSIGSVRANLKVRHSEICSRVPVVPARTNAMLLEAHHGPVTFERDFSELLVRVDRDGIADGFEEGEIRV
jgi:hypothetical protein